MSLLDSLVLGASVLILGTLSALIPSWTRAALWIQAAGVGACGAVAAVVFVAGGSVGSRFVNGVSPALGLDRLSAFFVLTVALTAVPALIFASRYLDGTPRRNAIAALSGAFVAALLLVLVARDVTTFLIGWELMTLLPAASMLVLRPDRPVRHAAFVYLTVTHLGGAGVWISLLVLSSHGALGNPAAGAALGGPIQALVTISAIVGFGTKAGLMPMHSWLPRAHPVAPAHISALMSGVMIKVALYGLIRVLFEWAPRSALWAALALILIGALSAIGGVLYALFQHELKRLLAFHSIENVGIITLGLGASLMFEASGQPTWASIAFAAALLHTLNHAAFKSLLFLGAGAIEKLAHGHEIDHLGGLLQTMPVTSVAFAIGSMAIAGLPPLNGFASEWLTLQALLHLAIDRAQAGWVGPLAASALAATAAMAVLCFVKVVGLALLGRPRHPNLEAAREAPYEMRAAQLFLAALCVGLGLAPGLLVPYLASIRTGAPAAAPRIVLVAPGTGGLPTLAIAVILGLLIVILVRARGARVAAPAPAWTCGQVVEPSLNWTSSAFTKPLRLGWELVLRPERDVTISTAHGVVQSARYRGQVPHLFDTVFYLPLIRQGARLGARARRLQSGSLRSYALYLVGLILALLAVVRLGWLG
ncbi:MAG TPA: proton-conducting transporter membrane subunit [Candidatus Nitrosotalea sp.]|nr:proton-conducting transporter membrane subunit [Candidatus Nitrosotalea sp.]